MATCLECDQNVEEPWPKCNHYCWHYRYVMWKVVTATSIMYHVMRYHIHNGVTKWRPSESHNELKTSQFGPCCDCNTCDDCDEHLWRHSYVSSTCCAIRDSTSTSHESTLTIESKWLVNGRQKKLRTTNRGSAVFYRLKMRMNKI